MIHARFLTVSLLAMFLSACQSASQPLPFTPLPPAFIYPTAGAAPQAAPQGAAAAQRTPEELFNEGMHKYDEMQTASGECWGGGTGKIAVAGQVLRNDFESGHIGPTPDLCHDWERESPNVYVCAGSKQLGGGVIERADARLTFTRRGFTLDQTRTRIQPAPTSVICERHSEYTLRE